MTAGTQAAWRELEVARPDLVASDLDGTLLTPELELSPALPGALRALADAGVVFAICTGRMFSSARAVAARMGVRQGLAVCYQGAMVADLADGSALSHTRMPAEDAAAVVRRLRVLGRHVNAYIDDEMYVDEVDKWALHYTRHTGVELHQVDDLEAEVLRRPPTKLVAITDADDVTRILPDLQRRWRDRLFVERSQPEYIEFAAGGVSKSGALQWLCERLGLRARARRRLRRRRQRPGHAALGGPGSGDGRGGTGGARRRRRRRAAGGAAGAVPAPGGRTERAAVGRDAVRRAAGAGEPPAAT